MAMSKLGEAASMAPQFTMRLRDRRVQIGFPVRLTCQIVGVPRPEVIWLIDGQPMVHDGKKKVNVNLIIILYET